MTTTRDLIVVDIETTGLDPDTCRVLEIAAIRASDGMTLHIIPTWTEISLDAAPALAINRYFERRIWEHAQPRAEELELLEMLRELIDNNTFGGCNPRFDLACLEAHYRLRDLRPPRPHHRLADISNYAAGASQALSAMELPGLSDVCAMLEVENHDPHSAMGDAEATLACFQKIHTAVAVQ